MSADPPPKPRQLSQLACSMDGALMLGAALLFVTIFRKLGLGATLGYIVGGAIIGRRRWG